MFCYGQLRSLRPACRQNPTGSYMPDPTSRIPFSSVFSKEGMDHIVQNWTGSVLDGVLRVWPNTSGLEASWCAGIIWPCFFAGRNRPATSFPLSDLVLFMHRRPENIGQSQPGSDLVLADCVRFWQKWIRSASKPVYKNDPARFRPMLPS